MASAKPSVRCGTTRVGVLGTILSSSSKKCCCKMTTAMKITDDNSRFPNQYRHFRNWGEKKMNAI